MKSIDGTSPRRRGRWIWIVVVLFAGLHWDFWLWNDTRLWFGFLPAGLGYHALYSLAAGLLWALFIVVAWPDHLEDWANARDHAEPPDAESGGSPSAPEDRR